MPTTRNPRPRPGNRALLGLLGTLALALPPAAQASAPFANGSDPSWLTQMEASGIKFYDAGGNPTDCLQVLQGVGINAVRLRVWVNPAGGWCGQSDVVNKAVRAKNLGLRVLVDFHYSDTWADPGHQTKPAAWANDGIAQLKLDVANHTSAVLTALKQAGVTPEWVQVGNEVDNGMLWPDGMASTNMGNFAQLITSGYNAVKSVFPDALVIVHVSNGYDNALFHFVFDGLSQFGAKYDLIGMSLYPTSADWAALDGECLSNMNDMVATYGKPVMVVEVGMDVNAPSACESFITDLIAKVKSVPGGGGLGVFYWEPECYDNWQGYTMGAFGSNGAPTAAMDAFADSGVSPYFVSQPSSQVVASGSTVVFNAPAFGLPTPAYQWNLNGAPIAAANGPTLMIGGAASANAGIYTCALTSAAGSAVSEPAVLSVSSTADAGRLINLSTRALVGTGSDILIAGFVVGGAGTSGSQWLLVRASGPALVPFGVAGVLADPQLLIYSGSTLLGSDDGWAGSPAIANAAAAVGAFAWTNPASHDSAITAALAAGPYTAQVSGQSGDTGIALAEVYDATPAGAYAPSTPRLVNLSARVQVGSGPASLIAGFVVGGSTSRTVLVRASGPALSAFGVGGTLPDPVLELFSGSTALASNSGWGGSPQISAAGASVGAFAWTSASSSDSAILVTLPPGPYTAQVSGKSGDTGVALVEVYEVP